MTLWNVISASVKLPEEAQWKPANRTSVWVAVPSIDTCRRPTPNPAGYPPGRPVPEATVDWSSPTAWKLLKTQEEDKERMRGLTCAPLKRGRHVPQGDTLTGWHWHQSLYGPPSHHAHHHDREDGDGVPRHVHDEQIHGDLFERAQGDIPASLARQEEEQSTIHRQKKNPKNVQPLHTNSPSPPGSCPFPGCWCREQASLNSQWDKRHLPGRPGGRYDTWSKAAPLSSQLTSQTK